MAAVESPSLDGPDNELEDLRTAVRVLAGLVRLDNPAGYSLAQIAEIWGENVAATDVAALHRVEALYEDVGLPNDRTQEHTVGSSG